MIGVDNRTNHKNFSEYDSSESETNVFYIAELQHRSRLQDKKFIPSDGSEHSIFKFQSSRSHQEKKFTRGFQKDDQNFCQFNFLEMVLQTRIIRGTYHTNTIGKEVDGNVLLIRNTFCFPKNC